MPEDREIEHAARSLIVRYGTRAVAVALLRAETYEREGQPDAAAIWRRIIGKIREIGSEIA